MGNSVKVDVSNNLQPSPEASKKREGLSKAGELGPG